MSEYAPSPNVPDDFPADRVVGLLLLAFDAIGTCGALLMASGAHWLGNRDSGDRAGAVALAALIVLGVVAIVAFVHYGIYCGRRWAFIGGLILSLCGLGSSVSGEGNALPVVIAFSTMVYTALRLGGALGPRPG